MVRTDHLEMIDTGQVFRIHDDAPRELIGFIWVDDLEPFDLHEEWECLRDHWLADWEAELAQRIGALKRKHMSKGVYERLRFGEPCWN